MKLKFDNVYVFPEFENREQMEKILGGIFDHFKNDGVKIAEFLERSFNKVIVKSTLDILRSTKVDETEVKNFGSGVDEETIRAIGLDLVDKMMEEYRKQKSNVETTRT